MASLFESSLDPVDGLDCGLLDLVDLCEQFRKLWGVVGCGVLVLLVVVIGDWFVRWFLRCRRPYAKGEDRGFCARLVAASGAVSVQVD